MDSNIQNEPVMDSPSAVYLDCEDVPSWLRNKKIFVYQVIYTRELKVLIFYRNKESYDL